MTRTRTDKTPSFRLNSTSSHHNEDSMAIELNASEIRTDMVKILTYLKANLDAHRKDDSSFLITHVQALLYAERIASYALHDYPRHFQGDQLITFLWDTIHRIVRTATAWRTGKSGGDGQVPLSIIEK